MDIFNEDEQPVEVEVIDPGELEPLTLLQEKFAQAYVEVGQVKKAEKLAGTAYNTGHDMLKIPKVQARVAQLKERALVKHDITMDHIITKLAAIVDLDPAEAYDMALEVQEVVVRHDSREGEDGISIQEVRASLLKIPPEIRKLMQIDFTSKGIQIKFLDKLKAYEMLTKIKGGYAPEQKNTNAPIIQNIIINRTSSK